MLILKNVSKKYGNSKEVLKGINLKFDNTGFVSILGPSGCGKSTLLNLIGYLDKPTSGNIYINGYNYKKMQKKDIEWFHHKYVGFVYQNYNLINHLSIKDNIELFNNNNCDDLLKRFNLSTQKDDNVLTLSGGGMQRVSIARALLLEPKILLCDEPTGALDSKNGIIIMDTLKKISKKRLVIMVTHNEELANEYSDRIIKLKDGEIISDSSPINGKDKFRLFKRHEIKISEKKIISSVLKNIKSKKKRNALTILAFSIGLISLFLVLSISSGFNKSIDNEEKESLSKYPIYISESSMNIDSEIDDIFSKKEKNDSDEVKTITNTHKNILSIDYLNMINTLDINLENRINTYYQDSIYIKTISDSKVFNIKYGNNISNSNDVILLLDTNNYIDKLYLEQIGLNEEKYKYKDLIGYKYNINNIEYQITGIAKHKKDSIYSDLSGLIYSKDNFINNKIYEIFLYPKDYKNKKIIINKLKKYKDVYYTDYSSSIKSLSKTLMNAISIVLICFSLISLVVSTIMISIITYISVIERVKEIGVYKTIGINSKTIKHIFYLENSIIAFLSSLISIIFVLILSVPINKVLSNITGLNNILLISFNNINIIVELSIFLSYIGSFIPIRKINKLNIVDCFKYE